MASTARPEGVINSDALYTLDEIQQRLGLGTHALRMARRAGLQVRYVGRRGFVVGADLIEYVRSVGKQEK